MSISLTRSQTRIRFEELINSPKSQARMVRPLLNRPEVRRSKDSLSALDKLILFSGVKISALYLLLISLSLGVVTAIFSLTLLPIWVALIIAIAFGSYPFAYLDRKAQDRSLRFASDFPSVLLATASSLTAGHTALVAIERSTRLLPKDNMVRKEISNLLDGLRTGLPREIAIKQFAPDIRLAELELFRSAFLLSLDSGGRLSPTLERLSQVLKDRSILISSARTATAVMRMTSNVLLLFTPLIIGMVAIRTPNFLLQLTTHPVASQIGSLGLLMIALNCWILRRMSDFRP